MTRSLLALAAIAAASVAGIWLHAAGRDGARPATPPPSTAVLETSESGSAATARPPTAPAVEAKAPARQVPAKGARSPVTASRDAEPEDAAPIPGNATSSAAMRVAKDPVTGQLVTPEHSAPTLTIEEMQGLARQEAEGLVTIRNADGSETLNHDGRFADFTVLRVGPGGRPMFQCVHGRAGVGHALRHATPVTPSMEDR